MPTLKNVVLKGLVTGVAPSMVVVKLIWWRFVWCTQWYQVCGNIHWISKADHFWAPLQCLMDYNKVWLGPIMTSARTYKHSLPADPSEREKPMTIFPSTQLCGVYDDWSEYAMVQSSRFNAGTIRHGKTSITKPMLSFLWGAGLPLMNLFYALSRVSVHFLSSQL